ncbi:alpha-galactosidase [Pedobacter sp. MC2016-15]|uniref:alpha-galactosidase n=1 Tax=Pedobacter sp. MC2016-15 TaxID=2994473 RepID=UPI002245CD11|nr:alpha-galactosidase [Pedobacter sp. MC2016-15]MCX2477766.1 alpha-galactosidase [Pedobacter sp. MC2016-15]
MRKYLTALLLFQAMLSRGQELKSYLPVWKDSKKNKIQADWLITKITDRAEIFVSEDHKDIILDNGLLRRTFRLRPNLSCTDFTNLSNGQQLLRAVKAEARITINGKDYNIGGLYGQPEKGYLKIEWINQLRSYAGDFQYKSYDITTVMPYLNWKPSPARWAANQQQPTGKMVTFNFESGTAALKGIVIKVNYELYDGIPLVCKWISIENRSISIIKVDKVVNEILAVHEEESSVAGTATQLKIPHGLYIESNYAFNNSMNARLSDQTTNWKADTSYTSQVNYLLNTPCLLEVHPPVGPGIELIPGAVFKSIRTNELLLDSYDRERNGLAQRIFYRTVAPWATQNPIYLFLKSFDETVFKKAVDQCAAAGFEMVIFSFGTAFNMEYLSEKNISFCKKMADYAHSKGIQIGGYSLLASRRIDDETDVIDPKTGKPNVHAYYAHSPCLGSKWGLEYFRKLKDFYKRTGFDEFDQDGAYPGDVCASTKHPGHKGLDDSQWKQIELQKDFYRWCAENAIFLNTPDWYFLDGGSKCALGYREVNFSLPRAQQIILNRQNIYDATWEKMPSMGWGFVPLTEYHGGGAAATLEPLSEHLDAYEQLMMQYFGAGIQACYLGTRIYDTDDTKRMVSRVVTWYKTYRMILNSQIIHLRRPDGRDWDGILHVDPRGKEKALVMLYNPLNEVITKKIKLPLYYTGLHDKASIREKEGKSKSYRLDKNGDTYVEVAIPANGYTWLVVE